MQEKNIYIKKSAVVDKIYFCCILRETVQIWHLRNASFRVQKDPVWFCVQYFV